jgi:hypothetical protein
MVDMAHPDIGGEPTLYTAHQAYREFHFQPVAAAQSGRFASDGVVKRDQTRSRLDPQNGCVIRYRAEI